MYFKFIVIFTSMLFYFLVANATLTPKELADFYEKVTLKDKNFKLKELTYSVTKLYKIEEPFVKGQFTLATVRKYIDDDKPNLLEEDVDNIILHTWARHMSLEEFLAAMNEKFTDWELDTIYDVVERRGEPIVVKTLFSTKVTKKVTKDGVRNYFKKEFHIYKLTEGEVEGIIANLRDEHMTREEFKKLMRSQDNIK
ncbi:uncharacterized protein LOC126836840 [Adelges cooleyi]|uniref:uncharacterized protein LOC126836840 n=1 Tax=Adelges cooleyi TaxID=133065 RepID=UPI00218078EC|nr:uncharacterized protein LOC126836840 [Adelges cooleyi]